MNSIRLRLLKWLIGPIVALNLAAGALTWLLAWLPAQTAFDENLSNAAQALSARLRVIDGGVQLDLTPQAEQVLRADPVDMLWFTARTGRGRILAGDGDFPAMPPAASGPRLFDAMMRGMPVRVVMMRTAVGGEEVQIGVAKTMRKRDSLRAASLRMLVLLGGLFTLALAALAWLTVTNGLLPLNRLRTALNARDQDALAPVTEDVPYELVPVVRALNDLLDRLRAGARAQQDFLADVAHQLRTPLAGLRTQLEWLRDRHLDDRGSAEPIAMMVLSTERMVRHTNQLLALARAEPSHFEKQRLEPVDLARLVSEVVQVFVEQAGAKGIDLGFHLMPTVVLGDRFLLRDLIDNLVDNALRYTPQGGTVNVSCRPEAPVGLLIVDDTGPGIPAARREAVFQRFVRLDEQSTGTGLGLAIVRDIVRAHEASLTLDDQPQGHGCVFTIRFALA